MTLTCKDQSCASFAAISPDSRFVFFGTFFDKLVYYIDNF